MVTRQKNFYEVAQKVFKTLSKKDILMNVDIFVEKEANTSSKTDILKFDFLAN